MHCTAHSLPPHGICISMMPAPPIIMANQLRIMKYPLPATHTQTHLMRSLTHTLHSHPCSHTQVKRHNNDGSPETIPGIQNWDNDRGVFPRSGSRMTTISVILLQRLPCRCPLPNPPLSSLYHDIFAGTKLCHAACLLPEEASSRVNKRARLELAQGSIIS